MRAVIVMNATCECNYTNCDCELTETPSKGVQFEHVVETVRLYTPTDSNLVIWVLVDV